MKKRYLFLMTLFIQLIMTGVAFAADPPQSEYDAAMASITDGAYYLFTEVDGIKYYVDHTGSLVEEADRQTFEVSKVSGGALYDVGILLEGGTGNHFSNTTLTDDKANLHPGTGVYRLDGSNNRNDWERQVFYLGENGKFAIRSCNTAFGESSWADAGRAFWTYEVDEAGEPIFGDYNTPEPCYSYEPAYIWEFETPPSKEQLYNVFNGIYTTYEDLVWEPDPKDDPFNEDCMPSTIDMGTGFGQLSDWATWKKLWDLLQVVNEVCDKLVDPDYDLDEDEDAPTLEEGVAYSAAADSMWQAILDSEVPYIMEQDGYYRIYAVKRYRISSKDENDETVYDYVDKAIAASFSADHKGKAVYGTVKKDWASYVWKLTKSETGDSVLIQNVGMGTYVSFSSPSANRVVMTEDVNDASYVQFDYAGNDFVMPEGIGDEKDLFAIRLAGSKRVSGSYVHQNNHGSVADEDSPWGAWETNGNAEEELTFWNTTRTFDGAAVDKWTSEWYLVPVSEEEVAELTNSFGPIVEHELLVQKNNELRSQVAETLNLAKDIIRTPMITSVSQLDNRFGDTSEGQHPEYLLDGDASTFWHTTWHGLADGVDPFYYYGEGYEEGLECHYLQISGMDKMVGNCELYLRERDGADNDRVKTLVLMGTDNLKNEDDEWEEIARITLPNTGKGEENTVPFTVETAYPYVRAFCIETASSSYAFRQFWHAAELQIYTVEENPNSQFVLMGEVAQNLQDTYDANVAVSDADITEEIYQALLDAYNAFQAVGLVDPAEMRAALQTYAKATEGVVEGQNPGYWADVTVASDFDALYAEIDAYNKAGVYNAAQVHKYSVMLKAMQKSVMEKANGVKTDKWYRIMVPTDEMYEAYDFSKEGVDKCGDLVEDQWTLCGNFVTTAQGVSEEVPAPTDDDPDAVATKTRLETTNGEDVRESDRLFFMADDEIEDKDVSKFRFVELESDDADYTPLLLDVKENMGMALDMSTTYKQGEPLITNASQFSSNASYPGNDGQKLESGCLIDNDFSTYWHSDYGRTFCCIPYLQIALNEPVSGLIQVYVGRRNTSNGHVVRMYVQGSNDAETWTNIGYIETPYTNATTPATSQPLDLGGTFSYLRFSMTNRYGSDDGSNIEFDPFEENITAADYNTKYTYFHASEFQIYPLIPSNELSASAQAVQDAYTIANKIVLKDATAEDVAAAAQAYKTYQKEFNATEGKTVLPDGLDKAPATYALQNKATGLFVMVDGTGNQNNIYLKTIPTLVGYKALGYQRSLLSARTVNGVSCNNLHVGESNRRFCTWGSTEPTSNSGLVICEADEEYAAPEEFTFFKDVKPGRIADWCHSVTITPVDAPEDAAAYTAIGQYTVGEDEYAETFLALKAVESIEAGMPALYIYGDTTVYDAEDEEVEPVKFAMSGNEKPILEGSTVNGLIGTLVTATFNNYYIYFNANYAACPAEGQTVTVTPCSAVLDLDNCPQVDPEAEYDFSICLGQAAADVADGVKDVSTALEKISQRGNVYSMDGKLLRTNATLNSLKTMGKGMYILNGVKVVVK